MNYCETFLDQCIKWHIQCWNKRWWCMSLFPPNNSTKYKTSGREKGKIFTLLQWRTLWGRGVKEHKPFENSHTTAFRNRSNKERWSISKAQNPRARLQQQQTKELQWSQQTVAKWQKHRVRTETRKYIWKNVVYDRLINHRMYAKYGKIDKVGESQQNREALNKTLANKTEIKTLHVTIPNR